MNFIKSLILISTLLIILDSCGAFSEAGKVLRNEKRKTTDEFLIQKKDPLTQPPDFRKIPEPGSIENSAKSEKNSIEKIFKTTQVESGNKRTKSSSTEESILEKIKK